MHVFMVHPNIQIYIKKPVFFCVLFVCFCLFVAFVRLFDLPFFVVVFTTRGSIFKLNYTELVAQFLHWSWLAIHKTNFWEFCF